MSIDMRLITKLMMIMFVFLCSENNFLFTSGASADEVVAIMCKDNERKALLTLRKGLATPPNMSSFGTNLSTWRSATDNMECCNWNGVQCSSRTGHVVGLVLTELTGEIRPALLELRHLNKLDLSNMDFGGNQIPEFIGYLQKLKYLSLASNNFSGDVPYHLGNLNKLRELDLSSNQLTSKDLTWLFNLTLLSKLDFRSNNFSSDVPYQLGYLTNLTELDLSVNNFKSKDLTWLSNLTLLSVLDLSSNQFEGPFPDLKAFSSLKYLYVSSNRLTGQLPVSIGQFSNLITFDASQNSLTGTISEVHVLKLHSLSTLMLSFNSLALNFSPDWIPPFQLWLLDLAGCDIGLRFPTWLQTQLASLMELDISFTGISGELPDWFWDSSDQLVHLNLSNNHISGYNPDFLSNFNSDMTLFSYNFYPVIDISVNNFSGPLPSFPPNSVTLRLSDNKFSGSIQSICGVIYDALTVLDLSHNQFSGELPTCWKNMTSLSVLNLDDNNLSGHLPRSLGYLTQLETLQFRNNNVTGELPSTLTNIKSLRLLDGGVNKLTGKIPTWIGKLANLSVLSLPQNNFSGSIPQEICGLALMQVLDLSENSISGKIPLCFNKFSFTRMIQGNDMDNAFQSQFAGYTYMYALYVYNARVHWKRQESEYRSTLRILKLIDLSSNELDGGIPKEIYGLSGLVSLNLSQNRLTGNINSDVSQMGMLEALDLSRNKLSGIIPDGLAQLHFLSLLDLSSNNLWGEIPKSIQLQSFNESSYHGNTGLCGEPLPRCPSDIPPSANPGDQEGDYDEKRGYIISALVGFVVGFWFFIGPLLYSNSWRNTYFGYLNKLGDWLYVTVAIYRTRLRNYMKSRK